MNNKQLAPALILSLLLTACGSGNQTPPRITLESETPDEVPEYRHTPRQLDLPITNQWDNWHCNEGDLTVRYADSSKARLQVRYAGGEQTLEARPGNNPATFENGQLAFHSDGKQAVLARPASAEILMSGCHP